MIIDLLGAAGITATLMYGTPTKPIRLFAEKFRLGNLFKCALCLGFWVGILIELVLGDFGDSSWILFPFATASFSWALDALVNAARETYIK